MCQDNQGTLRQCSPRGVHFECHDGTGSKGVIKMRNRVALSFVVKKKEKHTVKKQL